jgi:hypothetical protein
VRWWKILGLAGLAGVAASGAVTVHAERRRRAYTPEEIRARLHERVAESRATDLPDPDRAGSAPAGPGADAPAPVLGRLRARLRSLRGRLGRPAR